MKKHSASVGYKSSTTISYVCGLPGTRDCKQEKNLGDIVFQYSTCTNLGSIVDRKNLLPGTIETLVYLITDPVDKFPMTQKYVGSV